MPNYDRVCAKGHVTESFEKMTDDGAKPCAKCGGQTHRKIGSGIDPVFKGPDFACNQNERLEAKRANGRTLDRASETAEKMKNKKSRTL